MNPVSGQIVVRLLCYCEKTWGDEGEDEDENVPDDSPDHSMPAEMHIPPLEIGVYVFTKLIELVQSLTRGRINQSIAVA